MYSIVEKIISVSHIGEFSLQLIFANLAIFFSIALLEILVNDWRGSALYRIIYKRSKSTTGDLWCWFLSIFKLYDFFSLTFSIGLFYVLSALLYHTIQEQHLILLIPNVFLQFFILFVISDFKHFVWHYFMHRRPFWQLHKYHHSAEEFNLITTSRGHFIETSVLTIFDALVFLVFGLPLEDYLFFLYFRETYSHLLHSNLQWHFGWIGQYIFLSPIGHRIHHSKDPKHFNKNYGSVFVWWDRLFGTFFYTKEPIEIGVEPNEYNKNGFWKDMFFGAKSFLKDSHTLVFRRSK